MARDDNTKNRIENGNAWDDADEVVQIEVKKPLDKVIPVRLSSEKWEQLRREANELGIGPTTLARMWILKTLQSIAKERDIAGITNREKEVNYSGAKIVRKSDTLRTQVAAEKGKNTTYNTRKTRKGQH
jgi:hypothetical protein